MELSDYLTQRVTDIDYKRLNEDEIAISVGKHKGDLYTDVYIITTMLKTMAKISYNLSRPVKNGFFEGFDKDANEIDFSQFTSVDGLHMDYVFSRRCKTSATCTDNSLEVLFPAGHYARYGWSKERPYLRSPELFLDIVMHEVKAEVKSGLEIKHGVNLGHINEADRLGRPTYWDRVEFVAFEYGINIDKNDARKSRLEVALALDKDERQIEAIEIMSGQDFKMGGLEYMRLIKYLSSGDSPQKFYNSYANIDKT